MRAYGFVCSYGAFACFVVAIGVVCAHRLLFTCWGVSARLSCDRVIGRLTGADGEPTPHFASLSEGEAFLSEQEAAQRGGFTAGAGDGEAKTAALTECGDGSGLAVDAAGRWYRDGALVENMVEAVRDDDVIVVLAKGDGASVISDGNTNVDVRGGSFGALVNVGYHPD